MRGRRRRTCAGCFGKGEGPSLSWDDEKREGVRRVITCPICGGRGKTTAARNREFLGVRRLVEQMIRTLVGGLRSVAAQG